MNVAYYIGRLLGLEETQAIQRVEPALAAPWAQSAPAWLLFGCLGFLVLAIVFYTRYQYGHRRGARMTLAISRALLLSLLLLILAEPVLTVRITSRLRPSLWLLFDGTDSMAVADDMPEDQRARLAAAVGAAQDPSAKSPGGGAPRLSREDYVKALLKKSEGNLLTRLGEKFRLRAFLFDRPEGVRAVEMASAADNKVDPKRLAEQLTTDGQVTALGAALDDLARRHATSNLAGLVVVSDFNQNAGPPAVQAAQRLGVSVHTVGIGPIAAADVGVDLQAPPVMKKDERSTLVATVRQDGLAGQTVTVRFAMREMGASGDAGSATPLGERTVKLDASTQTVDFPYVPTQTGQFLFTAEVEPLPEEVVTENNRAQRESMVRDDFIRLLFVEYEPTWEWRFVKEVFHRDKLVGERGFRTFLRSADPKVRQTNELFLPALTPPRSEFFAHDVIVIGDLPSTALSPTFCRMTEEFVGKFGGGLVVLSGARFGPGQLAQTPLGDLLPVKVDPNARRSDRPLFSLARTVDAAQYDFMRLGGSDAENDKAWNNLGQLSWYQPVERLRPMATALAEHPTDTCVDGKTRQPIIAAHYYGRGEVIYLGFNESWRLRRLYGEQYYRQFWGQMIHRLALRHALGSQKRFVVRTDRRQYQADDQVLLTVEAYDANFEPLTEDKLTGRKLSAELVLPGKSNLDGESRPLGIAQLREGIFETRFPAFAAGEHRVKVKDPITNETAEATFRVAAVSVERQRAVRNVSLEQAIADATGGKSYDLTTVAQLPDQIQLVPKLETNVEVISLWNTWLSFGCVVLLMLGEWLGRKWVNLP
jgi:hypothetical protein